MKFKQIILAMAIPALAFLASCGGGSSSSEPKPSIKLNASAGSISASGNVEAGTAVTFDVTATAGSDAMKSIKITATLANGSVKTIVDTALVAKTNQFTRTQMIEGSAGDDVVYTFTANDANGQSTSLSITLSLTVADLPLEYVLGQKVYNALAVGFNPAYNLDLGVGVNAGGSSATKDILDKTPTGAAQWANTWGSGNGSKFLKCTANDYNNAQSTAYLFNLWKAGKASATDQISGMKVDDVYLVKSGQDLPFAFYILKITNVVDLPAVGNNNDYIQFDYIRITK